MSEFDIIERHFAGLGAKRADVVAGVGDDGAVLRPGGGRELVVSVDTLVEGVHFLGGANARSLGWKSLAVNLSDLAAMGAEPAWFTLSLTLPDADRRWIAGFAGGLDEIAIRFGVALVGGDTVRGPRSITVTVIGMVPEGGALRRDRAQAGDDVWVSGTLGDAALALSRLESGLPVADTLTARLDRPEPRIAAGIALRSVASSAIDLSDGLLADLGHIARSSGVGARVSLPRIPVSPEFSRLAGRQQMQFAAAGGDDYELCFTAPSARAEEVDRVSRQTGLPLTRVGRIETGSDVVLVDGEGAPVAVPGGFDHFRR